MLSCSQQAHCDWSVSQSVSSFHSRAVSSDLYSTLSLVPRTLCVCFVVLMTRMLFEQVSDVADAAKPMTADRSRRFGSSSYWGSVSFR